eukprot:jgi/Chlat1/6745/Chrsp50S06443
MRLATAAARRMTATADGALAMWSSAPHPLPPPPALSWSAAQRQLGSAACGKLFARTRLATLTSPATNTRTETTDVTAQASSSTPRTLGLQRMKAYYSDHHRVTLPDNHRFPMDKYAATRALLASDPTLTPLMEFIEAPAASLDDLTRVHTETYVDKVVNGKLSEREARTIGFPYGSEIVKRSLASAGGTVAAMHVVLGERERHKAAANVAGGTHHAFPDHGEGFCVWNDIGVAAGAALTRYADICNINKPILVIDLDGNGTAAMFEGDSRVITFSMHGANNYPWRSKMKSDYDVELADGTGDQEYLTLLAGWLSKLFDMHKPSLVFYQAGVDCLTEDSFGRLSMTRSGLLRRNNMVYSECIARDIPLVITMGGGYSQPSDASIRAHADVYRSAAYRYCGHLKMTRVSM